MANKNEIEYYGETTQYSLSINGIKKTGTLIKCENTYYFCYNVENNKYLYNGYNKSKREDLKAYLFGNGAF